MRGKKSKQLKKTFRIKTAEVLIAIRNEYGEATKYMTESVMFNKFKQMYKRGKIKQNFLVKIGKENFA
jgi:hypothetical protein